MLQRITSALALLTPFILPAAVWAADNRPEPMHIAIAFGPGKGDLEKLQKYLETNFHVTVSLVEADKAKKEKGKDQFTPTPFSNVEALETADVIVSNLYRTWAPAEQFDRIQELFRTKPVVGLRKAHHGFQNWLSSKGNSAGADTEIFGVAYRGHYFGKNVAQSVVPERADHPLVDSLDKNPLLPGGGLYQHVDVADDVTVLIVGGPEDREPMPQTWFRVNKETGQRSAYTRYDPQDLRHDAVRELLIDAIFWAVKRDPDHYRRSETP